MNKENNISIGSGFAMLFVVLAITGISVALFITKEPVWVGTGIGILVVAATISAGFISVEPNTAKVLLLFGEYKGSVRESGFKWANPFYTKKEVSLRGRNLNGKTLKVNDALGNPIEIAAVVVWQVEDTFKAILEVENFTDYVDLQSEAAVRHLANSYPYDNMEDDDVAKDALTLRGGTDLVMQKLQAELEQRLAPAGIIVKEARISHLAYAQEIAHAMLQRQQATAVIAARRLIVEGAVGMVEMAIARLEAHGTLHLDEERKAAMVSNLMVVLCSERSVSPVVNAGSLY